MTTYLRLGHFVVSVAQFFAVVAGVKFAFSVGSFWGIVGGLCLTGMPLIGSLVGVYGAVNAWDWSLLQAAALFLWWVPVLGLFVLFESFQTQRA